MDYSGWAKLFRLLRQHGFAPRRIIDVGAIRGNWTRTALQHFPDAEFILIEPLAELEQHVEDLKAIGRVRWMNCGVGDRSGTLPFTITPRDDSNGFVPSAE